MAKIEKNWLVAVRSLFASSLVSGLIFVLSTNLADATEKKTPPPLPAEFHDPVVFGQIYNIPQKQFFSGELAPTIPVYEVWVPKEKLDLATSRYIPDSMLRSFVRISNGRTWVRQLFLNSEFVGHFESNGYAVQQKLWGTKVVSHSTHFAWAPNRSEVPFFVKFPKTDGNSILSVRTSDFIERLFDDLGMDPRFGLLREVIGSESKIEGLSLQNVIREATSKRGVNAGLPSYPLYGFLGSPLLEKVATIKYKTPQDFLTNEYLPLLAKYVAELFYRFGFYLEAHTQNLGLSPSLSTGAIENLDAKDFLNMGFDAMMLHYQGGDIEIEHTGGFRLNEHPERYKKKGDYSAGHFAHVYLRQSVFGLVRGQNYRKTLHAFVRLLLDAVAEIVGERIVLTGSAKLALETYGEFGVREQYQKKTYFLDSDEDNKIFQALAEIVDSIREQVLLTRFRRIKQEKKLILIEKQYDAAFLFRTKIDQGHVGWWSPESRIKLTSAAKMTDVAEFYYDGTGISAIDKKTGLPLAVVFDVVDPLDDDSPPIASVLGDCSVLLQ